MAELIPVRQGWAQVGEPPPPRRPILPTLGCLHQSPYPSVTTSLSSQDPLGLCVPALEFSNPHGGSSAGWDWLPGWGRPSFSPLSLPPLPDRVSQAWHGGPICFQSGPALSAPSSGLWLGWGPLP